MELLAHPAAVHVPLALAVLFPVAYAATLWAVIVGWLPKRIWYGLVAMSVIQIVATLLAYFTGTRSVMYAVGDPALILHHAQLGRVFILLWIIMLPPIIAIARSNSRIVWRTANVILVALVVGQLVVGIALGKAGGALAMH